MREATRALDEVDFGLPGLTPAKAEQVMKILAPIRAQAGDVDNTHAAQIEEVRSAS